MEVGRVLRTEECKCPVEGQEPTREAGKLAAQEAASTGPRAPREEHEQRAGSGGGTQSAAGRQEEGGAGDSGPGGRARARPASECCGKVREKTPASSEGVRGCRRGADEASTEMA